MNFNPRLIFVLSPAIIMMAGLFYFTSTPNVDAVYFMRDAGIEPASQTWEVYILPLN